MKFISLGLVARPHGLSGAFVLAKDSGKDSTVQSISALYLKKDDSLHGPFAIHEVARLNRGWKIQLKEFHSLSEIQPYIGAFVTVPRDTIQSNGPLEFFVEDLIGLAGFDEGTTIGVLSAVEPGNGGPDRWWFKLDSGQELAVPAVKEYVVSVDVEGKRVTLKNTQLLK